MRPIVEIAGQRRFRVAEDEETGRLDEGTRFYMEGEYRSAEGSDRQGVKTQKVET